MIKILFVCHGSIDVSVDKLFCSTISHGLSFTTVLLQTTPDMINRDPGDSGIVLYLFSILGSLTSLFYCPLTAVTISKATFPVKKIEKSHFLSLFAFGEPFKIVPFVQPHNCPSTAGVNTPLNVIMTS